VPQVAPERIVGQLSTLINHEREGCDDADEACLECGAAAADGGISRLLIERTSHAS
jgi:hypothetical protein